MAAIIQTGDNPAGNNAVDNRLGPGPGRPKGSVNKVTADIRAMIIKALKLKGGVNYLAKQADENPVAFMSLLGKILPKEITGPGGGPITVIGGAMTPEQAAEAYAATLRNDP